MLLLVVGFLTPFLAFTAYYLYANGAFLLIAVAVAPGSLAEYGRAPELVERFPKRAAVALAGSRLAGVVNCLRLSGGMDLPDNLW